MKKVIALLLTAAALLICIASCAAPDKEYSVHLTVKVGGINLFDEDVTVKVPADSENGPSVIAVVQKVAETNDTIVISNGESLSKWGVFEQKSSDYLWDLTINGNSPKEGKANTNYLADGDKIVYNFLKYKDGAFADYSWDNNDFGEND